MNREILFRGKRADNGKWIYGGIVHQTDYYGTSIDEYRIIDGTETEDNDIGYSYKVIPDSVGQYTGLTDKNGLKVFEGDIVRHDRGTLHEVVFEHRNGNAYFGWVINELETWNFDSSFLRQLEVVGNVQDNPELLKGGIAG